METEKHNLYQCRDCKAVGIYPVCCSCGSGSVVVLSNREQAAYIAGGVEAIVTAAEGKKGT